MSFFKVIGPLNPPKNGGLIRLEDYKSDGSTRMGVIVKARMFAKASNQRSTLINDDVLILDRAEDLDNLDKCYSPFGDMGYELEIVWSDGQREFWMLRHPRPSAIGAVLGDCDDGGGLRIGYRELVSPVTVLVA